MITNTSQNTLLPWQTFFSFEALRVAKPVLAWINDVDSSEDYLRRYSYCIPLSNEPPELYINSRVAMLAERYGGDGIGVNGGGVRCGNIHGRQIKGVGRTDLAGIGEGYWHSYGGATLHEALRETIWGEVFNKALPFGAITVEAIIVVSGSELELHYPTSDGNTKSYRALMVRPQFIRPAHYLRATLFHPSPEFKASNPNDTERTRAAIKSLHLCLIQTLDANKGRSIIDLLTETYQRFAIQIATARAKRLFHGALSPSNISLDGRFLDFGMSSSVSDFGRVVIARGCPDAWLQHSLLAISIYDLVFFIRKYSNNVFDPVKTSTSIINTFQATLDYRFSVEILKLTGIPNRILLSLPNS
jgi:hypothetical protein